MTGAPGLRRIDAHGKTPHPQYRLKRQVVQKYRADETFHGLARRHDLSRSLRSIWVDKYETGAFNEDAEAAAMKGI